MLASGQLLYEFGPGVTYGDALHAAALATISGEPLGMDGALAKTIEVVLALYAAVLFAALAGPFGAFFLHHRVAGSDGHREPDSHATQASGQVIRVRQVRGSGSALGSLR